MVARRFWAVVLAVTFLAAGFAARADLYDDDKKVTSGDLKDLDYWHTKFYHLMLEAALKAKQPEYLVGNLAAVHERSLNDLIKKYPKHEDLKKWLALAEDVQKRVNKNADRLAKWKPDFEYWDNTHYRQVWVNMNLAKMHADAKEWPDAASRYAFALDNADKLVTHEEWMKNWPEDVVKWVKDTHEQAEKLAKEMKKKA
jgi:hypothetical protein